MSDVAVFLASVAVYAGLPLLFSTLRTPLRFLLLYAHLASVLTLGGLLGAVYVLPVFGVSVLAGQLAYAGFMFATLVTLIAGRDLQVLRNVVTLTVTVDVVVYLVFRISFEAMSGAGVINPSGTPVAIFDQSLRSVVLGGVLIVTEIIAVFVLLETAKQRLSAWPMAFVYVGAYVGVLVADGVLFPLLVVWPAAPLATLISAGVQTKLVLAAAFVVPLLAFVALNRRAIERFEDKPLPLRDLVALNRDPILERLDESVQTAGRATATLAQLFEAASSTILVATDTDLRITRFNRGAQRLLGFSEEEVLGRRPTMLIDRELLARQMADLGGGISTVAEFAAKVADGTHRDWEYRSRSGEMVLISLSVTEIRDGGDLIGYLAAGEDVTTRARAEAALAETVLREQAAVARLEEADRVKDELVSTVSHELRTPITSIRGYTEMLVDGAFGELPGPQGAALAKVHKNTRRLQTLVDDLLFVARDDDGRARLRIAPADLGLIVEGAWDSVVQLAADHDHELEATLPEEGAVVSGDAQAIERVVVNLVSNAAKYTPRGGRIHVTVTRDGDSGVLVVRDTGIGIRPDDVGRVFERFFRSAEANERAIQGSGLGLSVVHGIVTAHGGTIELDSTPGEGTTVTVCLPMAASS